MAVPPFVASGELIESAWGNDVVDTLTTHGSTLTSHASAIVSLQQMDNTLSARAQANSFNGTTNASGEIYVPFATPFPNGIFAVAVTDFTPLPTEMVVYKLLTVTLGGFTLRVYGATGAVLPSWVIRIAYVAGGS